MVARTKAALAQQIANMIDSGGTPRIPASDLRGVLTDIVDSLALLTSIRDGQTTVQLINATLGGSTWQGGSGGGITLDTALNAILVDTTPLDGIELDIDRGVTGHITIGLQAETIVHTNYLGIKATNVFVPADFTVDAVQTALTVPIAPDWPDGARRYVAYARPTSMGDFSYVYYYAAGSPNQNSQFGAWEQAVATVVLGGEDHNVLVSRGAFRDTARGRVVEAG